MPPDCRSLKNLQPPAGSKTTEELRKIAQCAGKPFIIKGIMTARGAKKAMVAGASGIVVSNHGGRVLDNCPSTAEVLPEIVDAVGGRMTILVDGGIRSGMDVFKALALGADGVLIGRPFVTMVYGGGAEGRANLRGKAESRAGRHHGHVRRALPGGNQPHHDLRGIKINEKPASFPFGKEAGFLIRYPICTHR
jgi:tryptophan synthase alpha subunit